MRKTIISISGISAMVLLGACGGGDSNGGSFASTAYIGYLVDSAVKGVNYSCGAKTDVTDSEGRFVCTSLPVSFHIGQLSLGSISRLPSDTKVFPQDLIGVGRDKMEDSRVISMAIILQSLDSDGDASNGITISSEQAKKFTDIIDISKLNLEEIKSKVLAQDTTVEFKPKEIAQAHLKESIEEAEQQIIPEPKPEPTLPATPNEPSTQIDKITKDTNNSLVNLEEIDYLNNDIDLLSDKTKNIIGNWSTGCILAGERLVDSSLVYAIHSVTFYSNKNYSDTLIVSFDSDCSTMIELESYVDEGSYTISSTNLSFSYFDEEEDDYITEGGRYTLNSNELIIYDDEYSYTFYRQ